MTIDRAIEILTPELKPKRTPAEYEEALAMARMAIRLVRHVMKEEEPNDG